MRGAKRALVQELGLRQTEQRTLKWCESFNRLPERGVLMKGNYPFSQQTVDFLSRPPVAGGTHRWLACAAGRLHRVLTRDRCAEFLRQACTRWVVHRCVPEREILAAVALAYDTDPLSARPMTVTGDSRGFAGTATSPQRRVPRWPTMNKIAVQKALALQGGALFDPSVDTGVSAKDALNALFKAGELVCAGMMCERPDARLRDDWDFPAAQQYVCANPLKGPTGLTKDGRPSVRCQSNIAVRRWIIAECDDPALNKGMQAKILTVLARALPLRLVVDSGGKSLHGWFFCEGLDECAVAKFFGLACVLGADLTRWDKCGWVRMPGGVRVKGDKTRVRQRVVYFDQGGV